MTTATFWLGRGAAFAMLLCLAILLWGLFGAKHAPGRARIRAYIAHLDRQLRFLRSKRTGTRVAVLQAAATLGVLSTMLWNGNFLLLLLVPFLVFAPKLLLAVKVSKRAARFESQIENWLGAISNALKASPSLGEAIASTISLVPAPMSEEVDILVKENELGTALDTALDNFANRIPSKTILATVLALKVARKSGGNLPAMLDSAAEALRELARLEGVVRTKTAEGRAQAWLIGAIPVPMVFGLHAIDPEFYDPLFLYFTGHLIMGISGALWMLAIFCANRILAVDV